MGTWTSNEKDMLLVREWLKAQKGEPNVLPPGTAYQDVVAASERIKKRQADSARVSRTLEGMRRHG